MAAAASENKYRVAVDIGGTFTDIVACREASHTKARAQNAQGRIVPARDTPYARRLLCRQQYHFG
jgi:pantothenate kinase